MPPMPASHIDLSALLGPRASGRSPTDQIVRNELQHEDVPDENEPDESDHYLAVLDAARQEADDSTMV